MNRVLILLVLALTAMPAMLPAFASPAADSDYTLTVLNPQGPVEKESYPDTEIVHYAELPMKFAPENEVLEEIIATDPDAVVAGFGG